MLWSIYGCIEAAMLWYNFYTKKLKELGFELNTYDMCVANKIINGQQCTICWHIDDNKVSHKERAVVEDIIEELEKYFGAFSVVHGKNKDYLGMNINIRDDKKVSIDMIKQIKELIEGFSEKIDGYVTSPAGKKIIYGTRGPRIRVR